MRRVVSVHQLLDLHDAEFVDAAHHTLFGRPPDNGSRENYIRVLREGHDKEAVLYGLAISPEANQHAKDLHDLPPFMHLQRRLRARPFGPLLKIVYLFRRHRMQVNRIENMLGRLQSAPMGIEIGNHDDAGYKGLNSLRARDIFRRLRRA